MLIRLLIKYILIFYIKSNMIGNLVYLIILANAIMQFRIIIKTHPQICLTKNSTNFKLQELKISIEWIIKKFFERMLIQFQRKIRMRLYCVQKSNLKKKIFFSSQAASSSKTFNTEFICGSYVPTQELSLLRNLMSVKNCTYCYWK